MSRWPALLRNCGEGGFRGCVSAALAVPHWRIGPCAQAGSHRAVCIFDACAPEVKDVCGYFFGSCRFGNRPGHPIEGNSGGVWIPSIAAPCQQGFRPFPGVETLSSGPAPLRRWYLPRKHQRLDSGGEMRAHGQCALAFLAGKRMAENQDIDLAGRDRFIQRRKAGYGSDLKSSGFQNPPAGFKKTDVMSIEKYTRREP